jgi:hypothetical protein
MLSKVSILWLAPASAPPICAQACTSPQTNKVVITAEFVQPTSDQQGLYDSVNAQLRDGSFQAAVAEAAYPLLQAGVGQSTYANKI